MFPANPSVITNFILNQLQSLLSICKHADIKQVSTHSCTMGAQCEMHCGTGLCKMFKRSMLMLHRIEQWNIMPRHRTAYLMNNAKNH